MKLTMTSKRSSPPGAAHLGQMFRGMSRVMLAPEPSGGAGGGAGGSGGNPAPPPAPTPEPPPNGGGSGGGERTFTQADVDRIVDQRIARERQGRSGNGQQQQAPARQQQSDQPQAPAPADDWDLIDAMDDVVREANLRPTSAAKKALRDAYRVANPNDPAAFVRGWFTNMGLIAPASSAATADGKQSAQQQQQQQNTNSNAGAGTKPDASKQGVTDTKQPPISNLGPPSGGPREFESITDPADIGKDVIERLEAAHGTVKANAMIRQKVENWAKGTKLTIQTRPQKR